MELQGLLASGGVEQRVNLDSLPDDIIRLIIRDVGLALNNMRLISPRWNAIISKHLSDRRNQLPLGTVHLHSGSPENPQGLAVKMQISPGLKSYQLPFRGWTEGDIVESPSLRVIVFEGGRRFTVTSMVVGFNTSILARRFDYSPVFFVTFALFFLAFCLFYYAHYVGPKVKANKARLSLLFSRIASIETLCLHEVHSTALKPSTQILGDVPVKNLIFYDKECHHNLRKTIAELARVHKPQTITVCVKRFDVEKLWGFIRVVSAFAPELEIYETDGVAKKIFGRPYIFWKEMIHDLREDSFAVEVVPHCQSDIHHTLSAFSDSHPPAAHYLRFKCHS